MSDAGGKSKIRPTSKDGASYQGASGYGFMLQDPPIMGVASLPVASPISIMTNGDPNHTAVDSRDNMDGQKTM